MENDHNRIENSDRGAVQNSTQMTCSQCGFWTRDRREAANHFGTCECEKFQQGYCIKYEDLKSDEILVENDEGWGFETGQDFGCIHFSANLKVSTEQRDVR